MGANLTTAKHQPRKEATQISQGREPWLQTEKDSGPECMRDNKRPARPTGNSLHPAVMEQQGSHQKTTPKNNPRMPNPFPIR